MDAKPVFLAQGRQLPGSIAAIHPGAREPRHEQGRLLNRDREITVVGGIKLIHSGHQLVSRQSIELRNRIGVARVCSNEFAGANAVHPARGPHKALREIHALPEIAVAQFARGEATRAGEKQDKDSDH